MDLKYLTNDQLNLDLKKLVGEERVLLTKILYHLKEVEVRKLFCDYGCTSLFDYACKELKYSADQAYRRIQAMRLLKEIPELSTKIDTGELSLTNINQAQRFFNDNKVIAKKNKISVLKKLINKSTREGQKELLKMSPVKPLPLETKKQVSPNHQQFSFNLSDKLEKKLDLVKSLLGPKACNISMAELIEDLADLAIEKLQDKKFGRSTLSAKINPNSRYISKNLKQQIWNKAQGKCVHCRSTHNLNFDHIKPMALGGKTSKENLRLLCFNCNQRQRMNMKL